MSTKRMYKLCKRNQFQYVQVTTVHGMTLEGFIENVDRDHVYMLVPMEDENREDEQVEQEVESSDERQFYPGLGYPGYGYPGYGYPGYPPYPPYGYHYGYNRPLRRLIVPLIFLTALSTLR